MAILDSLINEVGEKYGLGNKAGPLLSGLLSLMTNEQTGGVAGFVDKFKRAGWGDLVSSWISRGANNTLTPSQLETALGESTVSRLASNVGISSSSASSALAFLVPKVIDMLTPDGVLPASIPAWAGSFLGGAGTTARQAVGTAGKTGGSLWRTLLPLAALALLAFVGFRYCSQVPEQATNAVVAPTATLTVPSPAAVASAGLGEFIEKRLPNGFILRIPSNGVESKLLAFIEDPSRQVDKETWFSFDRLEFETGSAALKPASDEQLRNISEILKAYPQVNLKLGGYTDNVGNDASNLKLSQARANSTMQEIVKLGTDPARLEAEGYGSQHPVADNSTEEGRQRNRRIDVRVTKK
jgi:outer membrane protein OmpA-like peptidoglycan-associated protein/uncharacterized protein YidB (DUF937 family)